MKHTRTITAMPAYAQDDEGELTILERLVLLGLSNYFAGYQNLGMVIQNLTRFYQKT